MATPMNVQASQQAQQKLQDSGDVAQKQQKTNTRFDQAMQSKAESIQNVNHAADISRAQATEKVQQLQKVEQLQRSRPKIIIVQPSNSAEKVRHQKPAEPTDVTASKAQKSGDNMMPKVEHYLEQLNTSTHKIDQLIKEISDKNIKLDQRQLIKMQVQVYGYSMELDLTGKIVDKASGGLKDTLKTQV